VSIKGIGPTRTYDQIKIMGERNESAPNVKESSELHDEVSVSGNARLLSAARETAAEHSGIRSDKVAQLKAQVAAGTYAPDGKVVAEKILSEELDLWE